jgi:hypothetical protein
MEGSNGAIHAVIGNCECSHQIQKRHKFHEFHEPAMAGCFLPLLEFEFVKIRGIFASLIRIYVCAYRSKDLFRE